MSWCSGSSDLGLCRGGAPSSWNQGRSAEREEATASRTEACVAEKNQVGAPHTAALVRAPSWHVVIGCRQRPARGSRPRTASAPLCAPARSLARLIWTLLARLDCWEKKKQTVLYSGSSSHLLHRVL